MRLLGTEAEVAAVEEPPRPSPVLREKFPLEAGVAVGVGAGATVLA